MTRRIPGLLPAMLTAALAASAPAPAAAQDVELHMWTGARQFMVEDPEAFRTMLAFAARHGLVPYESGARDTTVLKAFFEATKAEGIERTWLEVGPGKDLSVREFVENQAARAPIVAAFRDLARVYRRHYPDHGRLTIFDEAPLGGFAHELVDGRMSYSKDIEQFRRYGPEAFAILYRALKEEMPNLEVGVFLHHPHNASPNMGGEYSFIAEFMQRANALGATPDFIYSDVYRGWLARGFGLEATNAYITDVVAHIRSVADRYGARAYQLGQMHTIKLGHTPSRWEIDTNVAAMLAGNPHGVGWYWPQYAATDHMLVSRNPDVVEHRGYDVSYDPFIPNSMGKIGPAGSVFATARDRFVYSYLRMLEATGRIDPRERFDLWIYGHDFDHVEHRVYVRSARDSDWTFLGSMNPQEDADGYVDGAAAEHIYSYDGRSHAVVFHALERDRFLAHADLQVRIETVDGSDGSAISAVYAMPYRETRNYATEPEVTRAIEEHPRWTEINSLANYVRPRPLTLGVGEPFVATLVKRRPLDPAAAAAEWTRILQDRGRDGGSR